MIGRKAGLALASPMALALAGCSVSEATPLPTDTATVAEGVATIDAIHLAALVDSGKAVLVDVRSPEEFAAGHIAGAINMPLERFDPSAVPHVANKQTVLYCRSGKRSFAAAEMLDETAGSAIHLSGGILAWQAAGLSITEMS
ncbi:MAG: rhodanese-like domain-containing protein [Tsuneonella sp.]